MSVRSAQSITKLFTTRVFATGVATNADSLPTGTLYVNGTSDAAVVTVTNVTTGVYKAQVTLPTLAVGDVVDLRINATVSAVTDNAVIWCDTKDVVIDAAGLVDSTTVKAGPSGSGTAQTARDLGASVLLSTGVGTGQLDFTNGVVKSNVTQLLGTGWLTPGVAGTPDVNVKQINAVSTSPVTTIKAVQGLAVDGVVTTVTNQLTAAVIATGIWQDATAGDFTTASSIGKALYTGNFAPGATSGLAIVGSAMTLAANQHVIVDSGTVTTVTNQLTAAAIATGVWQDATAGDFTVASSIGKTLYIANVVPGAAGGLFIAGSNAATTIAGLTTGAISATTITASGAVAFQSTFAVTTSTSLAALSCTTLTTSDTVTFNALTVSGATTLTGAVTATNASNSIVGVTMSAASVSAIWDKARASHVAAGSFGQSLQLVRDGTAQGGAASTITLDASASAVSDFYKNGVLQIIAGTGLGESNLIESYAGATKIATVRTAWATTPDVTSVFVIHPSGLDIGRLDASVSSRMPSVGGIAVTTFNADPLTLLIGFDHNYRNGNSVRYTNTLGTWPDLTNATVRLYLQGQGADNVVVGVVEVPVGVDQALHFDVPYSVTAVQVQAVNRRLYATATLANGDVYPLVQGSLRWRDPMEPA